MIFYNFESLYIISGGNSDLLIKYFNTLCETPYMAKALIGSSFILNPTVILHNQFNLTNQQLAEYLGVLSIRNYTNYTLNGETSLDIVLVYPWIPRAVLESNPLIEIKQNKLHFTQEENI